MIYIGLIFALWLTDSIVVSRKLAKTNAALTKLTELVGSDFAQAALEIEAIKLRISYLEGTIQQNPELFKLYAAVCNPTRFETGQ